MTIKDAYDAWSGSYDAVRNLTRDLEARSLRATVPSGVHATVLEWGCGTGKNTAWLAERSVQLIAVDFSADMLSMARTKHALPNVSFHLGDITAAWNFIKVPVDLVTCSLILEHVQDIDHVFCEAARVLRAGGLFYIGELHPFRQIQGSKARFETEQGDVREVDAFIHHLSDYLDGAVRHDFSCLRLQEWFDQDNRSTIPRVASFLFGKDE